MSQINRARKRHLLSLGRFIMVRRYSYRLALRSRPASDEVVRFHRP
jgi:hypothetical protein